MTINKASQDLIKSFESLRLEAYLCPAGVPTIGWGHTAGVKMGDTITEAEAERLFAEDVAVYEIAVDRAITRPITSNQRGAFVSLAYNIGGAAFSGSTAARRFNNGDAAGAAEAMMWWNKANGKVLRGLVRRREAERALFMSDEVSETPGIAPAPTPPDMTHPEPQGLAAIIASIIKAIFGGRK